MAKSAAIHLKSFLELYYFIYLPLEKNYCEVFLLTKQLVFILINNNDSTNHNPASVKNIFTHKPAQILDTHNIQNIYECSLHNFITGKHFEP